MTTVKVIRRGCETTMESGVPVRGDRIRLRRKLLRLSQEEAAARAGVDLSYWSQLENNKVDNPGLRTIQRIAQALDTSMSYLLGETDDPSPIIQPGQGFHDVDRLFDPEMDLHPEDMHDLEQAFRRILSRRRLRRQQEGEEGSE